MTVGGVVSRMTTVDADAVPPDEVASHVNVVPAVSATTVVGSHPVRDVTGDSASSTAQSTETSETYQPLSPAVPLTIGATDGRRDVVRGRTPEPNAARGLDRVGGPGRPDAEPAAGRRIARTTRCPGQARRRRRDAVRPVAHVLAKYVLAMYPVQRSLAEEPGGEQEVLGPETEGGSAVRIAGA